MQGHSCAVAVVPRWHLSLFIFSTFENEDKRPNRTKTEVMMRVKQIGFLFFRLARIPRNIKLIQPQ